MESRETVVNHGLLSVNAALARAARVPSLVAPGASRVRWLEIIVLLTAGAAASLMANVVRLRLGIPGSNIVFVTFPIAFGFALVPRRGAGWLMAGGALMTNALLWGAGVRLDGVGAQTSLLLTGPLLDLALRWASHGWRLYVAFVVACASTNAIAFVVRGAAKLYGLPGGGGGGGGGGGMGRGAGAGARPFEVWFPQAVWTYAAAGVVAGLVSAAVWFHFRARQDAGRR